jgi:hypothetical protein
VYRLLSFLIIITLTSCSTPFLIIQDSKLDSTNNQLLHTDLTGIWTSDKNKFPNGTLAIYKTTENYVFQNLEEGELNGVSEVTRYIKSKEIRNPYPSRIIKVDGTYFGVQRYPTKGVKDLPNDVFEYISARGVAMLVGVDSDEVTPYFPDVDRVEKLFPVDKPFYFEILQILSNVFGLKNRFIVKYKWELSGNDKYQDGPRLNKRMMLIVQENAETFLEVAARNGVFSIQKEKLSRVSSLEQADRSAAALSARAEEERLRADRALKIKLAQLEIDEKAAIAQNYPSRIETALQCASQFGRISDVAISTIQKGDDNEWIASGRYLISSYRGSFVAKAFTNPLRLKSINWTEITGSGYVPTSCF